MAGSTVGQLRSHWPPVKPRDSRMRSPHWGNVHKAVGCHRFRARRRGFIVLAVRHLGSVPDLDVAEASSAICCRPTAQGNLIARDMCSVANQDTHFFVSSSCSCDCAKRPNLASGAGHEKFVTCWGRSIRRGTTTSIEVSPVRRLSLDSKDSFSSFS